MGWRFLDWRLRDPDGVEYRCSVEDRFIDPSDVDAALQTCEIVLEKANSNVSVVLRGSRREAELRELLTSRAESYFGCYLANIYRADSRQILVFDWFD